MANYLVWWDSEAGAGSGKLRFIKINPEWTKAEIVSRLGPSFQADRDIISSMTTISDTNLPSDFRWNKAWTINNGVVSVSMPRAKALAKEIIKARWEISGPSIKAKLAYANATGNIQDASAAQQELNQWTTIKSSNAVQNATSTADLQTIIDQVIALSAPYIRE